MKKFVLLTLLIFLVSFVSAYSIFVTPIGENGKYQPNTHYSYIFNFTNNSDCTQVVYSASNTTVTDYTARSHFNLDISSITSVPSFLCEYRDGNLRKTHTFPDIIFRDIFGRSLNVSNNITASWFLGYINASNVLNANWVNNITNTSYRTLINGTFINVWNVTGNILINNTNVMTINQWNATNISYALNQTLTDMWLPFFNTTNLTYLMIDRFNITNSTYRTNYNLTWVGDLNSTGTVYSEGVNNLTIPFLFNSTGLIRNWNISGDIQNWNASTYIRNWGIDTALLNTTNLTYLMIDRFNVTNTSYLLDSGDTATGSYTFDTDTLFIDATGNKVGIGTITPDEQLAIVEADGGRFIVSNVNGASRKVILIQAPSLANNYGRIVAHNYGTGVGVPLVLQDSGGNVGINELIPDEKLHITASTNARIKLERTTTPQAWMIGTDTSPAGLYFPHDVTAGLTRMFISDAGNVGIGTTSPQNPLNVIGRVNSTTGFIVNSSTGFTGTCASTTTITVVGGIVTACS